MGNFFKKFRKKSFFYLLRAFSYPTFYIKIHFFFKFIIFFSENYFPPIQFYGYRLGVFNYCLFNKTYHQVLVIEDKANEQKIAYLHNLVPNINSGFGGIAFFLFAPIRICKLLFNYLYPPQLRFAGAGKYFFKVNFFFKNFVIGVNITLFELGNFIVLIKYKNSAFSLHLGLGVFKLFQNKLNSPNFIISGTNT